MTGNNNDDFLSDIDAAIEGGSSNDESFDDIANDVAPQNDKLVTNDVTDEGTDKIEKELLDLTNNDDDVAAEKAEAEKQKREKLSLKPDAVDADRKQREEQQQKEAERNLPAREDGSTPAQTTQQQKRQRAFMDRFMQEDDKGNFVTPSGSIIATSGESRSFFEGLKREAREHRDKAERLAMENADVARQLQEQETRYKQLQESDTVKPLTERTGMNEAELNDAIGFLRAYKQDPLDGIKKILTSARANGIDISSLGVQGGLDLNVVRDMIRNEVRPQGGETPAQRQPDPQEMRQAIEQEITTLVNDDADAKEILLGSDDETAKLRQLFLDGVSKYPNVPVTRLWYSFKKKLREIEERNTSTPQPQPQSMWKKDAPREQPTERPRKAQAQRNYATMDYNSIARSVMDDLE